MSKILNLCTKLLRTSTRSKQGYKQDGKKERREQRRKSSPDLRADAVEEPSSIHNIKKLPEVDIHNMLLH